MSYTKRRVDFESTHSSTNNSKYDKVLRNLKERIEILEGIVKEISERK